MLVCLNIRGLVHLWFEFLNMLGHWKEMYIIIFEDGYVML